MKKSKALGFEMYTADHQRDAKINLATVIFAILIIGLVVSFGLIARKTIQLSQYMMELESEHDAYEKERVMDALGEQRGVHPTTGAEMPPYWEGNY